MANKEKHLEFVLSTISRMAQNSFVTRGWCITLTTTILAVASNTDITITYALSVVPIIVFWVVDAYYLNIERRYRALFEVIRLLSDDDIDYSMRLDGTPDSDRIFSAIISPLLIFTYGSLIGLVSLVFFTKG